MRGATRAVVERIVPFDAQERADQRDVLAWIDSGEPIWQVEPPATPPEHLVVYCVLVDVDARALLLVDHRNAGLWLPTGGHVDSELGRFVTKLAGRLDLQSVG